MPSAIRYRARWIVVAAVAGAVAVFLFACLVRIQILAALRFLNADTTTANLIISVAAVSVLILLWPALNAVREMRATSRTLAVADLIGARTANAAARFWATTALGYATAAAILIGFAAFLVSNDVAVGKTFFNLPLMWAKWPLVAQAFWTNIFMFVIAECLVLVLGLAIAIGRLLPGEAGRPIRALCIAYCDLFRALPSVVTLYLIGFGLPLSGFVPTEIAGFGRIPVIFWAILALTLTYSAYVAEVYRAGIESIHRSQVAAARSLGLSQSQTLRYVVVPQAVRRILAPLLNDFIGLQKDTALVQVIGVVDAFNQSRIIANNAFNLSAVTIVAILFVLITIPQARFVDHLIERDNAKIRAGG